MKIAILAGGTGSIALQTGLHSIFKSQLGDELDIKVIVNAYDNGLSTGVVRTVLDRKLLGPSDVRKNQETLLSLQLAHEPLSFLDRRRKQFILKLLKIRFTSNGGSGEAKTYIKNLLEDEVENVKLSSAKTDEASLAIDGAVYEVGNRFLNAAKAFFELPMASKVDYIDFSLANILYAGLAIQAYEGTGEYSLAAAAREMADIMGIPADAVVLNDDRSLFLGAVTKSGNLITDEGEIVKWDNPLDPIVDVTFTDSTGHPSRPVLSEQAKSVLTEADLIIASSGTQWSSLIPTYKSAGFREALVESKAPIVAVMNRIPDLDAPTMSATDLINEMLSNGFPVDRLHIVMDSTGSKQMNTLDEELVKSLAGVVSRQLKGDSEKTHSPVKLAVAVAEAVFAPVLDVDLTVFDYDDTLVGRGRSYPRAYEVNKDCFNSSENVLICTGNKVDVVKSFISSKKYVYADGGLNVYTIKDAVITPHATVADGRFSFTPKVARIIIRELLDLGMGVFTIENRGNAVISIKPVIHHRELITNLLSSYFGDDERTVVKATGRTTIDISRGVGKDEALRDMSARFSLNESLTRIGYLGDELHDGNDSHVRDIASNPKLKDPIVTWVNVSDPAMTAMYFITRKYIVSNSANGIYQ